MKKLILLFGLFGMVHQLKANTSDTSKNVHQQRYNEDQTLLGKGKPLGFFIGINVKPAIVNDQAAFFTGGQIAMVFGKKLNVGFAGYGLTSPVLSDRVDADGTHYYYDMGYGGLLFEPVFFSRSAIHFTLPVLLGAGGAGFRPTTSPFSYNYEDVNWDNYVADAFFVAEPGLNMELNLFKWMRLDAGVSYRFISDGYFGSSLNSSLSGWSANCGLKFGWF